MLLSIFVHATEIHCFVPNELTGIVWACLDRYRHVDIGIIKDGLSPQSFIDQTVYLTTDVYWLNSGQKVGMFLIFNCRTSNINNYKSYFVLYCIYCHSMLQSITHGQMDCIAEIARRIYNQTFPLLTRDLIYFENRNLVLRLLISERVSFRRKVNTIVRNHRMIPRLIRTYYLPATIQDQIRTQREA